MLLMIYYRLMLWLLCALAVYSCWCSKRNANGSIASHHNLP